MRFLKQSAAALAALLFFGGISIGFAGSAYAQEKKATRPLTVDDQFSIKDVGSPRVSPDGKWVAYTVRTTSLKEGKHETRIWMKSTDGGDAIPMTAKGYSASSPQWSPDGRYLTFLASKKEDEKTQVWTLNLKGGDSQQLTHVKQGVSGYEWSPDASSLALLIRDPEKDVDEDGKKKDPEPYVIDRLQFKRDYAGYLDRRRHHIYVYHIARDSLRQITSGDYEDSDPAWSPDGKRIAFVSNRSDWPDSNSNTDIWIVSAGNTDKGQTLKQVTTNPGSDDSPAWSPDGKSLAYITVTEPDLIWYATNKVAVKPVDGGEPNLLTASLDRNSYSPQFTADGKHITFLFENSAEENLARIGRDGRGFKKLIKGKRAVYRYSRSKSGNVYAALISEPQRPGEVYLYRDGRTEAFSHVNDDFLSGIKLADVENIHFKSKDGTEIEGFLYKPVGYVEGIKYPTLLRIHGGPVAQFDFGFRFAPQLFAANGYAVVQVNPRGSSGYGQDFSKAIWADWGHKDYQDVMAGVDHAIDMGIADPEKLGVGGWSYGGILTDHVITQTNRFKGAITGASEVLYVANYGHDQYQLQWEKELGLPWKPENRKKWEAISPFNEVEKIQTPTLIMGGDVDWNVPIQNGEQLYQALKRLGRTTKLVVYPGEHHGISRPSFQKDRYERYLDWYDTYVKGNKQ